MFMNRFLSKSLCTYNAMSIYQGMNDEVIVKITHMQKIINPIRVKYLL